MKLPPFVVGRWLLESKTERSLCCFVAKVTLRCNNKGKYLPVLSWRSRLGFGLRSRVFHFFKIINFKIENVWGLIRLDFCR